MMTITRNMQNILRDFLEDEYSRRRTVGNRTLEHAMEKALTCAPVQEALSEALDIFLIESEEGLR